MSEFRELLEAGDVQGLRAAWRQTAPKMPQPKDDIDAEVMMHIARTAAESVAFKFRAYSHAWLAERSFPSSLPDHLRPAAQKLHAVVVEAVGISVNFSNKMLRPAAKEIERAMSTTVEECYADGDTDPDLVRARIAATQQSATARLFGRWGAR